jgi:glycosyltransferase involved in cell wall biosynthesis
MSAGLPAAVTAVGGNPEIVLDGKTGWVVASDDAPALTQVFARALSDSQSCKAFGDAGHQRFESRFTMAAMLASYRGVYDSMLGQPR